MGQGVRWTHGLIAGLLGLVLSWAAGRWWMSTGNIPAPVPWLTMIMILVLAGFVLWMGLAVRRYLAGKATTTMKPARSAATVALAQAAILGGAFLIGAYAGQGLLLVADYDFGPYRGRLLRFGLAALSSGVLTAVGGIVQHWCRIDPPKDDEERAGAPA